MTCSVVGCVTGIHCKSLCKKHYTRNRRHGDPNKLIRPHKVDAPADEHGTMHAYCYRKCRCRQCVAWNRHYQQKWREKNPDKARAYALRGRLARQYGMTPAEYVAMLEAQGGLCAICGQPPSSGTKYLYVDHDHRTSKVRALLCHKCNAGIGMLRDDPTLLAAATAYLLHHGAVAS